MIKCCGIILKCQDTLLMVHQTESNMWGFPKGHRRFGETNLQCALRELFEETLIRIVNSRKKTAKILYRKYIFFVYEVDHCYKATADGKEIDACEWIDVKRLQLQQHCLLSKTTQYVIDMLGFKYQIAPVKCIVYSPEDLREHSLSSLSL